MPKQAFKPRVCRICKRTFTPTSTRAKTCSPRCSAEYHRRFCLDKAREIAFLTPYDIDAYLAKTANPQSQSKSQPQSNNQPNDPPRTPEPTSRQERADQLASVNATMALPPSQRYQHARLWSNFQRHAAIAIEKRRLADDSAIDDLDPITSADPDTDTNVDNDQPTDADPDAIADMADPSAPPEYAPPSATSHRHAHGRRARKTAFPVPTLPPNRNNNTHNRHRT